MEEPFWPPDENVASSRDERGGPPRDQPPPAAAVPPAPPAPSLVPPPVALPAPPVVHGQPVTIDPSAPAFAPAARPREEFGSPWSQPPAARPRVGFEAGIYRPGEPAINPTTGANGAAGPVTGGDAPATGPVTSPGPASPAPPHPAPPPPPHSPAPGVYQAPAYAPPAGALTPQAAQDWAPEGSVTAEDFARRRAARPAEPVATMGIRGMLRKSSFGLLNIGPGRHEQEVRHDIEMVRRNFGGLRQVTIVNPKGGAGKTMAVLLLAMTFGQRRGGYVLAWDNNETQGTLGMRAQQDFHSRTVRDLLRDLDHFRGAHGRVGDLSQYVRAQGEGMFDVLASDESATAGEMLTAMAFADIREIVSRFYKLIFVDTGNNVRAENWQAAIDATDQLVVTMSARNDSAETAARMLDYLEQQGLHRLVRQAVTVVSMPPSRRELDIPAIEQHFQARTRTVLLAPYERLIDSGEPLRYNALSSQTRMAWLKIAAAVAEGL
uniref:MinD/ParA family ATP-binding protein n=1 Tax=Planosporangium flavigriseum TaxID=373681 RepID=UPI00357103C6